MDRFADDLAEQLGRVRSVIGRLQRLEEVLVAAVDVAYSIEAPAPSSHDFTPFQHRSVPVVVTSAPPEPAIVEPAVVGPELDAETHVCSVCPAAFSTAQGVAMHRRRVHEGFDPKARHAEISTGADDLVRVAPPSQAPQVAGAVFVCSTCEHEVPTVRDIARHCRAYHTRDAMASERMPVSTSDS